jgi:hypothetical protein
LAADIFGRTGFWDCAPPTGIVTSIAIKATPSAINRFHEFFFIEGATVFPLPTSQRLHGDAREHDPGRVDQWR